VVGDADAGDPCEGGVEDVLGDQEGVVLGARVGNVHVVEGDVVVEGDGQEAGDLRVGGQPQDVGQEAGGGFLVPGRDDCVVERDSHWNLLVKFCLRRGIRVRA
jgi:hypothetical protein